MSTGPSRRAFLTKLAAGLAAPLIATPLAVRAAIGASREPEAPALVGLTNKTGREIVGAFVNDDAAVGHQLRDGTLARGASNREVRQTRVAIVGGGMSGLSAGWRLDQLGLRDWLCVELGDAAGGNSRGGENAVSRYPWGAHYVPVPSPEATHVRALLREVGVLHTDGSWDERTLCHSPQERIWQHGEWHEGLEPLDAAPVWERAEWERFDAQVAEWRATGAFRVPLAGAPGNVLGSAAGATRALDRISASAWFTAQGYRSSTLRWWIEYGTRDDYGASLNQASAWAAAHYFAGRPAAEEGPLTWPEGNAFLVKHLTRLSGDRVITKAPTYAIEARGSRWLVRTPTVDIECDCVIWAAPLFVLPRVMPDVKLPVSIEYAPWVVANITLDRRPQERGAPMSWDNVIYGSRSLGYVSATHQYVGRPGPRSVWTWYHAIVDRPAAAARTWLQQRPWSAWRDDIVGELSRAHPDIAECITRIDVRQWGHAMARPTPGVLSRNATLARWSPAPRIFMAHADLSGLSLFEEAQWHGVQAAERAARALGGSGRQLE